MAKIFRDSSILNQFGSPSINSNTIANRPSFGQPGRLFVSTDTLAIYRDTGSAWDNLTAGGGTIGTLQQVTTLGNRTNQRIFIGPTVVTPTANDLDVYGYSLVRNTVDSQSNLGPIFYSQYTINYNGTTLSGFANSMFAQDIYNVSASTSIASSTQAGTSLNINTYKFSNVATITMQQPSSTIRAASAITAYSQFQNTATGTLTHAAGITILGVENLGGSALTITDNFQLLINASDEFASTATFTRQWGIYQNGANDNNYFAGKMYINTTSGYTGAQLSILGGGNPVIIKGFPNPYLSVLDTSNTVETYLGVLSTGPVYGRVGTNNNTDFAIQTNNTYRIIIKNTGNVLINKLTSLGYNFEVNGTSYFEGFLEINNTGVPIKITTTTATGVHTATSQHLPIIVNGVTYYLQLLN